VTLEQNAPAVEEGGAWRNAQTVEPRFRRTRPATSGSPARTAARSLARSLAQRERELVCPDHEFNRNAGFAGVAAAVGTALLLAVIYRVRGIRHLAMELMHRITGQ
jgi:hypothetical protein